MPESTNIYLNYYYYFQKIGEEWIVHLDQLQQLKEFAKDPAFQRAVQKVKQENKLRLTQTLQKEYNVQVNPASMFDIQVNYFQCVSINFISINVEAIQLIVFSG